MVVIAALILYEHTLVGADDFTNIPVAFFNMNAAVSLSMLGFTVGDVVLQSPTVILKKQSIRRMLMFFEYL